MTPAKILVADDHELVREAICARITARPDWAVCAEAGSGRDAVALAKAHQPDVAILDIGMPELNGIDATTQIRKQNPATRVLILTMQESEMLIHQALSAGALGYILKSDAARQLGGAIESLLEGKPYFTGKVGSMVLARYLDPDSSTAGREPAAGNRLTPREREILQLLAEGNSSKAIAKLLSISNHTVEAHRANIMNKLDLHSIAELVRYALRNNLIDP